jgi:hypothetical protein
VRETLENAAAPPARRIGAAITLAGSGEAEASKRILAAASECANAPLRVVLEAIAEGEVDDAAVEEALRGSGEEEQKAGQPMQRALEAKFMEQQTEAKAAFPPFLQRLIEGGKVEGFREGELKGKTEGKIEGKIETLLRLAARAGIPLTEDDRARIRACDDASTLDRWVDNVLGAKTAADVLA